MVRRLMLLVTFATTMSLSGLLAGSPAGAVTTPKVTGTGTVALFGGSINFNIGVVQNKTGVQGGALLSVVGGAAQEQLTASCLHVSGALATIRATVVSSTNGNVGSQLIVFVVNGSAKSAPRGAIATVGTDPYDAAYGGGCNFGPLPLDQNRFAPVTSGSFFVTG
ncbi:MAG TPA: hypothetical protein VKR22_05415 [Acidimicrobiales bacterium]|nr:hypothetical protein [Acidimicrobiales bacterium]